MKSPFSDLTKFERGLWITSIAVIIASFLLSRGGDILTLIASLIGVTALIFVAKGYILGQVLTVVFSVFYTIISFIFSYYGEMITYLLMTTPMAILAIISWKKHPFKDTKEVEVSHVSKKQILLMIALSIIVTAGFYFILKALGTANLILSTFSVTTSFVAVYLTYLRSPYYALGYSANDLVLIGLWIFASIESISYLPMVFCFIMFLANDIYGFINWKKMQSIQKRNSF